MIRTSTPWFFCQAVLCDASNRRISGSRAVGTVTTVWSLGPVTVGGTQTVTVAATLFAVVPQSVPSDFLPMTLTQYVVVWEGEIVSAGASLPPTGCEVLPEGPIHH